MNGYDFDGTLTDGIIPVVPWVIVTGRIAADVNGVHRWLKGKEREYGSPLGVYYRPQGHHGDPVSSGLWKAYIIHTLRLRTFYEDELTQYNLLVSLRLKCDIHLVSKGKVLQVAKGFSDGREEVKASHHCNPTVFYGEPYPTER